MSRIVQMDAIRRQRTSRVAVQLEGELEQINKGDPGLSGDVLNRLGVEPQVLVVSGAIGKVGVPQILVGDWAIARFGSSRCSFGAGPCAN